MIRTRSHLVCYALASIALVGLISAELHIDGFSREFLRTLHQLRFREDMPKVNGVSRDDLLDLVRLGRHHCTRSELQRRRDLCTKLFRQLPLHAYCRRAATLSENWCEKPDLIESPFNDLFARSPAKHRVNLQYELEVIGNRLNPWRSNYEQLSDEQKMAIFDEVIEALEGYQSRAAAETFNEGNLLGLVSMDESRCTETELTKRRKFCNELQPTSPKEAFCLEASERSVFWCKQRGLPANVQLA